MTWFFLFVCLVLFFKRDLRVGLEAPLESFIPAGWTGDYESLEASNKIYASLGVDAPLPFRIFVGLHLAGSLERLYTLERYVSPQRFIQMAHAAEQQLDKRPNPTLEQEDKEFIVFAALHFPLKSAQEDVCQFTERTVSRDPKLSWLLFQVAYRLRDNWESPTLNKKLRAWADKLQAWDPDNAAVYLFRAHLIEASHKKNWPSYNLGLPKYLEGLAQEAEWRKAMAEVFARPKFDFYYDRRFDLERKVLLRQGWNHPAVAASILTFFGVPDMLTMREYARLLVQKFGAEAENAGQLEKALGYYWHAERFGERLRLEAHYVIEDLAGQAIQFVAIDRLKPALKKTGREREAAALEYLLKQARQDNRRRMDPLMASWNSSAWSWLMVDVTALLTWVFFILSLASVVYVNAKLWIRRDKQGFIYRVVSVAESYLPLLLLVAAFGLYASYTPLAQNFSFYMKTLSFKERLDHGRLLMDNAIPPFTNATLIGRLAG